MMRTMRLLAVGLLLALAAASQASAQESVAKARDLYAAAEYEDALALLDALAGGAQTAAETQSIALYRSLCLIAVGRREAADKTIEAMIASDPSYRPGDEVSPKMRSVFADARKRLLPALIQQNYQNAKTAFDRKEFVAAASGFKYVVDTLADPDVTQAASQPPLADIRTLASGFHDLSVKQIPPPPPPVVEPVVPIAPRIYGGDDPRVIAPIAIQQELPKFPGRVRPGGMTGVVEVVISEKGLVEEASTVVSIGQAYDDLVRAATSRWQYYPARADGKPVKFRKRIQITVSPQPGL